MYAEALFSEFWIVNAAERCVEVYRGPVEGEYKIIERIGRGGVLRCASLPGVCVDVGELFAGLPGVDVSPRRE